MASPLSALHMKASDSCKIQVLTERTIRNKIYEGGPNKEFVVCLYAVNQSYHNDILKWFEDVKRTGSAEGFSMMLANFWLDSVVLSLIEI